MSSIPASMKRKGSKTAEKKWRHRFSHYKPICYHGNQCSDLAEFQTHPSSHVCYHYLQAGIQKSDFWPVHTDLEIFRPIYFMKNVFLSVRKMALFIYLNELNFVRPLSFEIFSCLVRKFTSFDQYPDVSSCLLSLISQLSNT